MAAGAELLALDRQATDTIDDEGGPTEPDPEPHAEGLGIKPMDTGTIETRHTRHITPQDISAAQDPDALLTVHTVAALTGFTVATVRERAREGKFPKPLRMGTRTVRWRARDVREWLQAQGAA